MLMLTEVDYKTGRFHDMKALTTKAHEKGILTIWDLIDINDVREKSCELPDLFIELVESSCPDLKLASPRDSRLRGSQVSFQFQQGYAAIIEDVMLNRLWDNAEYFVQAPVT